MALDRDIVELQSNALLACFDVEALRLIAFNTDVRSLRKEDILFRQGETADAGYFIQQGSMVLMSETSEQIHSVGALLGETALMVETTRPATAVALENVSVRRIPRHLMQRIYKEYPESTRRILDYMKQNALVFEQGLRRLDMLIPEID
jgi:CRP-like cAMP-binding protein